MSILFNNGIILPRLWFITFHSSIASWSLINRIQVESFDGFVIAIFNIFIYLKGCVCNPRKAIYRNIYPRYLDLDIIRSYHYILDSKKYIVLSFFIIYEKLQRIKSNMLYKRLKTIYGGRYGIF